MKGAAWAPVCAVVLAAVGCTSVAGQSRTAQTVAHRVEARMGRDLDSEATRNTPAFWDDILASVDLPAGIDRLIAGPSAASRETPDGTSIQSRSVAVFPTAGDPYCIIVAVASDGRSLGVYADGDPIGSCRHATPALQSGDELLDGW